MIQCQEFEILFIPFISASILIICCAYINYVQSYAIICKIYPFLSFFFIFAAFLGKNRDHRRVFCHSKQLILRPLTARPLAQKVAQPLSRRPAELAQICRRPPSAVPVITSVFAAAHPILFAKSSILSQHPSAVPVITSIFSATSPILSAYPAVLSATAPIMLATNYMLISGHETTIAKHDFLLSCPETTISHLAIILKMAAGAMALVSAQVLAYAGIVVIIIIII